jgi:hypothetical protein
VSEAGIRQALCKTQECLETARENVAVMPARRSTQGQHALRRDLLWVMKSLLAPVDEWFYRTREVIKPFEQKRSDCAQAGR